MDVIHTHTHTHSQRLSLLLLSLYVCAMQKFDAFFRCHKPGYRKEDELTEDFYMNDNVSEHNREDGGPMPPPQSPHLRVCVDV